MAGATGAYGFGDQERARQPSQKRERLDAFVKLGFELDMASLLANGLKLDLNEKSDASLAQQLLQNGLKDLATVKMVTGDVEINTPLVNARPAVSSLQELAPGLTPVNALKLAKGACAALVQRRDDSYEDLAELLHDRQTDELAEKIAMKNSRRVLIDSGRVAVGH